MRTRAGSGTEALKRGAGWDTGGQGVSIGVVGTPIRHRVRVGQVRPIRHRIGTR